MNSASQAIEMASVHPVFMELGLCILSVVGNVVQRDMSRIWAEVS